MDWAGAFKAFWSWLQTLLPYLKDASLVAGGVTLSKKAEQAKEGAEASKDAEKANEVSKQVDAATDADVERMWSEFDGKPNSGGK